MSLTLPTTTNGNVLAELCGRARPELAALGDLGAPLLGVLGAVEAAAAGRGLEVLDDPGFALDVLTAMPSTDPALVGRVLDFLRARAGASTAGPLAGHGGGQGRPAVSVADAVASYKAGALSLLARDTQSGHRSWANRLVAAHGTDDPGSVTAGDLKDLIARHITEARAAGAVRRDGGSMEAAAVAAYRHLWGYLVDKRWASDNVAQRLRKPPPDEPNRRPFRPEEAALIRHLARGLGMRDPLLNEVIITISERLGLRRIELYRLRFCDIDLGRAMVRVWGKGNKYRDLPIPPALAELLARYIESRRPADVPAEVWVRSEEKFLRHIPNTRYPRGQVAGVQRLDRFFGKLRETVPDMFTTGDLSQHCYRHSLGTFVENRYGRAVTKRVLGHKSRKTPTDHYIYVDDDTLREAICAYEDHLLAADPTHQVASVEGTEVVGGQRSDVDRHRGQVAAKVEAYRAGGARLDAAMAQYDQRWGVAV